MTRVQFVEGRFGPRLEVSHVLRVPAEAAWRALTDVTQWPEWSPIVVGVEASERRIEAGTTGRIETSSGCWLPFVVTAYDSGRRQWRWSVAHLPGARHRVDELGADRCRIAFELSPLAVGFVGTYLTALEQLDAHLTDENSNANGAETTVDPR